MANITFLVGSVYGTATFVAEALSGALSELGHHCCVHQGDIATLASAQIIIGCTSTTGSGEIPDNLLGHYEALISKKPDLNGRHCAVVALGDTTYDDSYCMAGQQLYGALVQCGATPLSGPLLLDANTALAPEEDAQPWLLQLIEKWSQQNA